ncbi:MAG: hypothetical protein M3Y27_20715 [Acidobacteriota bacterium]|nr:hypothetical protein [Acidobacteriota bacterium]
MIVACAGCLTAEAVLKLAVFDRANPVHRLSAHKTAVSLDTLERARLKIFRAVFSHRIRSAVWCSCSSPPPSSPVAPGGRRKCGLAGMGVADDPVQTV